MSKFTPGKWIYYPPSEFDISKGIEDYDILSIQRKKEHSIMVGHSIGTIHTEKDARLIVAAPKMYELLKVWTQVKAQPTLMNAQKKAQKLLDRIDNMEAGWMKTSVRKFNKQYRHSRLYLDGYHNPEIVETCNEHKKAWPDEVDE